VLNAFSEFLRNLLVCKDERIVNLLEVVESFKEKYAATAKKVSASYIISALNLLNEAEINYKAARNKRLHVELALIKLCYLQQALELTAEENGIGKKKVVESYKPVSFKNLSISEAKRQAPAKTAENAAITVTSKQKTEEKN